MIGAPSDRRGFLRGLVSLPLIGGGVTLIGAPSAPVPLVQAAALPAFGDPLQRARYAWEAFASAMQDISADADSWRVVGGARPTPLPKWAKVYAEPWARISFDSYHWRPGEDRARVAPVERQLRQVEL